MDLSLQGTSFVADESCSIVQASTTMSSMQQDEKPELAYHIIIVGDLLEIFPYLKEALRQHIDQNPHVSLCVMSENDALETYSGMGFYGSLVGPETIFIISDFEGPLFAVLKRFGVRIYGPTGVIDLINRSLDLISVNVSPFYSFSLVKAIIVFSGFHANRKKELSYLNRIAHYMGAKVKQEVNSSVTHLISPDVKSSLYDDSVALGIIILLPDWLLFCWSKRNDHEFLGTSSEATRDFQTKPFSGLHLAFSGYSSLEVKEMERFVYENGGLIDDINSQEVTHIVINPQAEKDVPFSPRDNVYIVDIHWFWESIKFQIKRPEASHLVSHIDKRNKKVQIDEIPKPGNFLSPKPTKRSPMATISNYKRKSKEKPISPKLEKLNKRFYTFRELLETEKNYTETMDIILTVFKEEIVKNNNTLLHDPLMTPDELKDTFNYIEPIINIHSNIIENLERSMITWNSESCIGNVYDKEVSAMVKAYSAYINFFEKTISLLDQKMQTNQRFHAIIKMNSRCQRQSFKDLLIRPVQRLPSVILLFKEILKSTEESSLDHTLISGTIDNLTCVLNQINEDKKRTSEQLQNVEIYNRIEECPADFLSSKRKFLYTVDCYEYQDNIKGKSQLMTMFVMCDCIEVTYKMIKKAIPIDFNMSPNPFNAKATSSLKKNKSFKHAYLIPFKYIDNLIEINDNSSRTWKYSFGLKFKSREMEEFRIRYYQVICETPSDRERSVFDYLMRTVTCSKSNLDVSQHKQSPMATIGRALENLAFKASRRMSRAFSINNSHNGLPRCMSVMSQMNPDSLKSSNNLGDAVSYSTDFENVSSINSSQILHSKSQDKKPEKIRKPILPWRRSVQPRDIEKR